MKIIFLIIAGIMGTLMMTLFMYLIGLVSSKDLNVIRLLKMIIFRSNDYFFLKIVHSCLATVFHFIIGIMYAFAYSWLWDIGVGKPNFFFSIIFGIASGLLGLSVWSLIIFFNSNKYNIPIATFNRSLFITHIIFAFTVFYTYLFLERYPLPLDQSLNFG